MRIEVTLGCSRHAWLGQPGDRWGQRVGSGAVLLRSWCQCKDIALRDCCQTHIGRLVLFDRFCIICDPGAQKSVIRVNFVIFEFMHHLKAE